MNPPEEPLEPSLDNSVRTRYIEALAFGLGCDEDTVKQSAGRLTAMRKVLGKIDPTIPREQQSPQDINLIENIGRWFLESSPQQEQLKYAVGATVLNLLRAPITSGYFTHLESWVGLWTDGEGVEGFKQHLSRTDDLPQE